MAFLCESKWTRDQVLVLIIEFKSVWIIYFQLASQIDDSYDWGSVMKDKLKVKCLCAGDNASYDKKDDKEYLHWEDELAATASEMGIVFEIRLQW